MPVTPTYPGVYVEELQSPVHTITGVATSIAAFVGYTDSGIDKRATEIFSFSDFERSFGGLASDSELSYAVQQFFLNGGTDAFVVRVPKHGSTAATVTLLSGIGGATSLVATMLSNGSWSDQVIIDVDYDGVSDTNSFNLTITNLADGTIESFDDVTIDNSKSDFVMNMVNDPDTGSQLVNVTVPTAPSGGPAIVRPAATGITGADITAATLGGLSSAKTYSVNLQLDMPFPTGTTAWPDIVVITQNGNLPGSIASLSAQLQGAASAALSTLFPGATVQCVPSSSGKGLRVRASIPNALDVRITFGSPTIPNPNPAGITDASGLFGLAAPVTPANVSHYWPDSQRSTWTGGPAAPFTVYAEASPTAGTDGSGLPTAADLIGDPLQFSGIYALEKVDLFNLLCLPDATRALAGNPSQLDTNLSVTDPNTVFSSALAYCKTRRAFLLIDPPPSVKDVPSARDWITSGLTVKDPAGSAAAYFPRLKLPDPLNNSQMRTFAPCGVVAGVYAAIDGSRGVWKAPAGIEATLEGVQGLVYKLTDNENGVLNPLGLNCFRNFPVYGLISWGARTIAGADAMASQWKYVPVRRLALFLEESLYRGSKWVVFEPNDEPLWSAIRLNIGSFMQTLFRQGAFQGSTPKDAYFVKCDSETTTQDDINSGVVNIVVGFAPLKPAEFVVLQIQQMAGQIGS